MNLQKEIESREMEFVRQLKIAGLAELVAMFADIITLRKADEVLLRPLPSHTKSANGARPESEREKSSGAEFVLRTAVRDQIQQFGHQPFTTRKMFDALTAKFPNDVTDERFASVSATLANLAGKELTKTKDGKGKMKFEAM